MDEGLGTWTGGDGSVGGGTCHGPVRLSIADGKVDRRFCGWSQAPKSTVDSALKLSYKFVNH